MKRVFIIIGICFLIQAKYDFQFSYGTNILSLRRLRSPEIESTAEWKAKSSDERHFIIEAIAKQFPRIDKNDLYALDNLILSGEVNGILTPLLIGELLGLIEKTDALNKEIYGVDYRTYRIRFIFEKRDGAMDAGMNLDKGELGLTVPYERKYSRQEFMEDGFFSYIHEDGHIKAALALYPDGNIGLPFEETEASHWLGALKEGNLSHPFLSLDGFSFDFNEYLDRTGGLFANLEEDRPAITWTRHRKFYSIIQEIFNHQLLKLIWGKPYTDYYLLEFEKMLGDYENKIASQDTLHRSVTVRVLTAIAGHIANIESLGGSNLAAQFRELGERFIDKTNIAPALKQSYQEEFRAFTRDLTRLTEHIVLRPEFRQGLDLTGVERSLEDLFNEAETFSLESHP